MRQHLLAQHHLMDIRQMVVMRLQITCLFVSKTITFNEIPLGLGCGGFFYGVISQVTLLAPWLSD